MINGKNFMLWFNDENDRTVNIAQCKNHRLSIKVTLEDEGTKDEAGGWDNFVPTDVDWSMSCDGVMCNLSGTSSGSGNGMGSDALAEQWLTNAEVASFFGYTAIDASASTTDGWELPANHYASYAIIRSINFSGDYNGFAQFSAEFEGCDGLQWETA